MTVVLHIPAILCGHMCVYRVLLSYPIGKVDGLTLYDPGHYCSVMFPPGVDNGPDPLSSPIARQVSVIDDLARRTNSCVEHQHTVHDGRKGERFSI